MKNIQNTYFSIDCENFSAHKLVVKFLIQILGKTEISCHVQPTINGSGSYSIQVFCEKDEALIIERFCKKNINSTTMFYRTPLQSPMKFAHDSHVEEIIFLRDLHIESNSDDVQSVFHFIANILGIESFMYKVDLSLRYEKLDLQLLLPSMYERAKIIERKCNCENNSISARDFVSKVLIGDEQNHEIPKMTLKKINYRSRNYVALREVEEVLSKNSNVFFLYKDNMSATKETLYILMRDGYDLKPVLKFAEEIILDFDNI